MDYDSFVEPILHIFPGCLQLSVDDVNMYCIAVVDGVIHYYMLTYTNARRCVAASSCLLVPARAHTIITFTYAADIILDCAGATAVMADITNDINYDVLYSYCISLRCIGTGCHADCVAVQIGKMRM